MGGPWVMTAAHCAIMAQKGFFEIEEPSSARISRATFAARHAELDVALLRADLPITRHAPALATAPQVGDDLRLIGCGMRPAGESRLATCSTLHARITKTRATTFVLKPKDDEAGACRGDSGAPVWKSQRGELMLLGLLTAGAESCRGPDAAVAITALRPWLKEVMSHVKTRVL